MTCRGNVGHILRQYFPDDVDSARLVDEIQDRQILVSRRVGDGVTPLGILKFIVSFGGNDVFPNLKVGL